MRLFQRSDIATVEVALEQSRRFRLTVERLNLYLFSSGSAILVLEVSTKGVAPRQSWSLADVQDFHDRFRRAYIPYATVTHGMKGVMTPPGDLVAAEVIWHHQSGPPAKFRSANEIDGMVTGYLYNPGDDGRRIPPVFGHWRELLKDALLLAPYAKAGTEPRWHHVVDERMPTLAAVAVTNDSGDELEFFRRTRRGDLVRLCFADSSGERSYPYDRRTLTRFEKDHTFQWFRQDGTIYSASGYAFVAYGAGGFFENVVAATHMR